MKRLIALAAVLALALASQASAQVVTFKATLTWADNSNNEDGFKIEKAGSAGGVYTQLATVGPNVLSYVDTGIAPGATVCYRVSAFNVAGSSAPSTAVCATAPAPPAAPGTLQIVITVGP